MTPERLAQLRQFARYVAYHVPVAKAPAGLDDADAGDDLLELCEAVARSAALVAAVQDWQTTGKFCRAGSRERLSYQRRVFNEAVRAVVPDGPSTQSPVRPPR